MFDILKIVLQWKKQILLFTLLAIVASIIITMPAIMTPYYKSKMVFYLSNPISIDRAALFNEKEAGGISSFGGKEDVNRFLTILNSLPVVDATIDQYQLAKHYKIKAKDASLSRYYTQLEFTNNVKAIRNDLGAIEVSVLDSDAKLAAKITKYMVDFSDSIYRNILIDNKTIVLALLDKQIAEKKINNNTSEELEKMVNIRDQYAVASSAQFKTMYVIEEPMAAVKKTKPVRWLIVLSATVAAFVFAAFIALLIELYKHAEKYGYQRS